MKRFFCTVLALILVVFQVAYAEGVDMDAPSAEEIRAGLTVSEGLEFESNGDGTCSIVGVGVCTDMQIVIPSVSPAGDTVTCIAEYAFRSLKDVESIVLLDAQYEIDERAFNYAEVEEIIVIGGSPVFEQSSFSSCGDVASILFMDCTVEIGEYAFYDCGKKSAVYFSNCEGYIDERAFQYSDFVTITFENCTLEFDTSAFSTCENVEAIVFNGCELEMGEYSFYSCGDEASLTFVDCEGYIDERAFQYSSFEEVSFADCDFEIDTSAFSTCEDIVTLSFTDCVLELGEYAFYSCGDSAQVTFDNCDTTMTDRTFQYSSIETLQVTGPRFEGGTSVFSTCEDLESVSIDCDSVELGEYAFYSCEDLVSFEIIDTNEKKNSVKIDDRSFQYCESMDSYTIYAEEVEIGEYVFTGCSENLNILVNENAFSADSLKNGYSLD